jgi:hypothetical protein
MKKWLLTFFIIFLFLPIANAQLSIEPSKNYLEVFSEETQAIELKINNLQQKTDTFLINILPSSQQKVSAFPQQTSVEINANSSTAIKIYFHADPAAEQTTSPLLFNIVVSSLSNPSIQDSKEVRVMILRKAPIFISEMKIEKSTFDPGENVRIVTTIQNTANTPCGEYVLETTIKKENEIVKVFRQTVVNVPPKSEKDYIFEYALGKYAPYGNYFVTSSLKDKSNVLLYEKSSSFSVRAVAKIPSEYSEKKTEMKLLAVYVTIKVKNEGNIATGDFYLKESIPLFAKDFFEPEIKPTMQQVVEGKMVYTWLIHSLEPGEEVEIRYQIVLWKAYILIAAIVLIAYISFKYAFGISLTKTYPSSAEKGKEITINLEVKNKGLKEVKDVYVADFLPSDFKLLSKFGTVKPYSVKTRERGTALMWKFDSLKGREEVVLFYTAKSLADIKKLELPKAKMLYVSKGKKKIVLSRNYTK